MLGREGLQSKSYFCIAAYQLTMTLKEFYAARNGRGETALRKPEHGETAVRAARAARIETPRRGKS
jgi:hypothetical protein